MKEWEMREVPRAVLKSATCDRCGTDCKNTHVDILLRFSFCEKAEEIETICYDCYEKGFAKRVKHVRDAKYARQIRKILKKDVNVGEGVA